MATLRELKGRIGSVASSEKITGAMKMISSAKMHKAEGVLRRLKPYRDCVRTIIASLLSSDAPVSSPLTQERQQVKRVAVVVFGSDDGLCGAYNVNVFKGLLAKIDELRRDCGQDVTIDIVPVGKKIFKAVDKIAGHDPQLNVHSEFNVDSRSDGETVKTFGAELSSRFLSGALDRVDLLFVHYLTAGKQRLGSDSYLPVSPATLSADSAGAGSGRPYLFEPDAASIFSTVLPMYLLAQMQDAFAENRASEQAARVMAMQSANDNAQKLLEQLQLEYNKLRQQGITTELLDIVGGQARD